MEIFDRWGSKIFESTNPLLGWDGRKGATPLPQGTYTFLINAKQNNGHTLFERGVVMLLR